MKYIIGYDETTRDIRWTMEHPDTVSDETIAEMLADFANRGFTCVVHQTEDAIYASDGVYMNENDEVTIRSLFDVEETYNVLINEEIVLAVPVETSVYIDGSLQGETDDDTLELEFDTVGTYQIRLEKKPSYKTAYITIEVTS